MNIGLESTAVQFLIKLTLVLTAAWIADRLLSRSNPRWQVLLWRVSTIGAVVVVLTAVTPPLYQVPMLTHLDLDAVALPVGDFLSAAPPANRAVDSISTQGSSQDFNLGTTQIPNEVLPLSPSSALAPMNEANDPPRKRIDATTNRPAAYGMQMPSLRFIAIIYVIGVSILLRQLIVSAMLVHREVRLAKPSSDWVQQIATKMVVAGKVSLPIRVTNRLETPALCGVLRPVILLPQSMLDFETAEDDLRGAIAHEASHAAGHDLFWDLLIALCSAFLWPHPFIWRTRSAHRAACERVSDRAAADALGDVPTYQRLLARIALRVAQVPLHAGLAMARRSDVRQRLAAVVHCPGVGPLGRAAVVMVGTAMLFVGVLGAGIIVMRDATAAAATRLAVEPAADVPAEKAEAQPEAKRIRPESLKFTIVRSSDGSPVADAKIDVHLYGRPNNLNLDLITNADGEATFEYPDGPEPAFLWAMVHHSGLVPYYVNFGRNLVPAALPTQKTIRMEPGKTIGGIIVDPDGKPVAGATVSILTPATDSPSSIHYHLLYDHSKEDGTWSFDGAPLNAASLHLGIEHPRYIRSGHRVEDRLDGRYTIDPGLTLTGKITDSDGKPIPTAHVTVGRDRWGSSREPIRVGADGTYTVYALKPHSTWVTAEAQGFSPQVQSVEVDSMTSPIDFQLASGHTTKFQIVDSAGEPIVGSWIVADTWNGFRSLWWRSTSDAQGLVTWNGAPADVVQFDIGGKDGNDYASVRNFAASPQEEPYVIVLKRCLKIEGTVTGAKNQKIPEFRVEIGRKLRRDEDITWITHNATAGRNGKFQISYNEACEAIYLRIEADGFRPWHSEAIPFDETDHKLFVKLESGSGLSGTILTPDGQPAVGAKLSLSTSRQRIQFTQGFRPIGGKQTVTSDEQGQFHFLKVEEDALITAVHDSGYAEFTDKEIAQGSASRLEAWAGIDAVVRRGKQPHGSAVVHVYPNSKSTQQVQLFSYGIEGRTSAEGHVRFDRVVPRDAVVAVTISQQIGSITMNYVERSTKVSLEPGKIAKLEMGGTGSEVFGRLSVKGDPPCPHSWLFNEAVMAKSVADSNDSESPPFYQCLIEKDGSFRLYDTPAGRYELQVALTAAPNSDQSGTGPRLGIIRHEFEVPAGNAPVDVGVIQGAWDKRLGAGDDAPQFVATGIGREAVRLSDFHGKLLLIDFWATQNAVSIAGIPQLEKLQQKFTDEKRVQILGLSIDNSLAEAEETVTSKHWNWLNAFAGPGTRSTAAAQFDLLMLPEKFLVDLDGKILYRGRDLKEIETLIQKRLSDWPAQIPQKPDRGIAPVKIEDNFTSGEPVSLIMALSNEEYRRPDTLLSGPGFKFWSEAGQEIRKLDEIGTSAWLTGPQRLAVDSQRNRIYLCDTFHRRLVALNRSGQQLFTSKVPGLHAAAVDEAQGDIWCLTLSQLHVGEVVVLDSTGREKLRHPVAGFGIAYSPAENAFWITGRSIAKVNRDGRAPSSHPLPAGRYTFTEIAVDRQLGGAWVLEDDHPDLPLSRKQLWKVKSDGSANATHQIEQSLIPRSLVSINGKPWLSVVKKSSVENPTPGDEVNAEILRFDSEGLPTGSLPVPAIEMAVGIQSGAIWVQTNSQVLKIDQSGQTLLAIPESAGRKCVQLLAF